MSDDKEYSRPATVDDLRSIVIALNKNNAPYILIGGYALFAQITLMGDEQS